MSHLAMCVRWCLPLALLGLPSLAAAQAYDSAGADHPFISARDQAKALFETSQATVRDLARERRNAALTASRVRYEKYCAGAQDTTLFMTLRALQRLLDAELALSDSPAERVAAHEVYWDYMRSLEYIVHSKYRVGRVSLADYAQAIYMRLDAEIQLAEARAMLPPSRDRKGTGKSPAR